MGASISSQPEELLDHMCSFVESPSDLLHIGLVSKRLQDIVFPHHIEFRAIRCDVNRVNVWEQLAAHSQKALAIRSLDLVPEFGYYRPECNPIIFPRSLLHGETALSTNRPSLETFNALANAIRCMPHLTRFHYGYATCPAMNEVFDALYETCKDIRALQVLQYDDSMHDGPLRDHISLGTSQLWNFSNLTSFSFTDRPYGTEFTTYIEYIGPMVNMVLDRCPHLQDLQIMHQIHRRDDWPDDTIRRLIDTGSWPDLRRLSVETDCLDEDNAQAFFSRHQSIEQLSLHGWSADVVLTGLPNLRSLDMEWIPEPGTTLMPDVAQNLTSLSMQLPDEPERHTDELSAVLVSCPKLLYLTLWRSEFSTALLNCITESAPGLERLALIWLDQDAYEEFSGNCEDEEPGCFADFLSRLPKLTHLSYMSPDLHDGLSPQGIEEPVASAVPSLRYVEFGSEQYRYDSDRYWIRIERAVDGSLVCQRATNPASLSVRRWGNIYRGAAEGYMHQYQWE